MKKVIFLLLLPILLFAETRYYFPVPIESSNGRPFNGSPTVIVYPTGTTSNGLTLTQGTGSIYYYTSEPTSQAYDVYVNGVLHLSKIWWVTPESSIPSESITTSKLADSSVTSAKISGFKVANTTALEALTGKADGDVVFLEGITGSSINGSGDFVLIDSAYTEQYPGIIFPASIQGKQWIRKDAINNSQSSILWFGAKGDTTGGNDDTQAIQNAINFATTSPGGKASDIIIPSGIYRISSTLIVPYGVKIYTEGNKKILNPAKPVLFWDGAVNDTMLTYTGVGNVQQSLLKGITFDGNNKAVCVYYANKTDHGTTLYNCQFIRSDSTQYAVIYDNGSTNGYIEDTRFDACGWYPIRYDIDAGTHVFGIKDVTVDNNSANDSSGGFIWFKGDEASNGAQVEFSLYNFNMELNDPIKRSGKPYHYGTIHIQNKPSLATNIQVHATVINSRNSTNAGSFEVPMFSQDSSSTNNVIIDMLGLRKAYEAELLNENMPFYLDETLKNYTGQISDPDLPYNYKSGVVLPNRPANVHIRYADAFGAKTGTTIAYVWSISSPGDVIVLSPGEWTGQTTITDSYPDSILLLGSGRHQTIINGLSITDVKGVQVKSLTSRRSSGNGINFASTDSTFVYNALIEDVSAYGYGGTLDHGILIQTGNTATIRDFDATNASHGVAVRASNVIVTNGRIIDNSGISVTVKSGLGSGVTPDDGPTRDVIVSNLDISGSGGISITATNSDIVENITVSNITNNGGTAVVGINTQAADGNGYVNNVLVSNCIGKNITSNAFSNAGGINVKFINCIVDGSSARGFYSYEVVTGSPTRVPKTELINCWANNCTSGNIVDTKANGEARIYTNIVPLYPEILSDLNQSGTGATRDTLGTINRPAWTFPDAATTVAGSSFLCNTDMVSGYFYTDIYWVADDTSGNVRWGINYDVLSIGDTLSLPTSASTEYSNVTPSGINTINKTTISRGLIFTKDDIVRIAILRVGADAGDTSTDAVHILSAQARY